jgi:hypothetical protein
MLDGRAATALASTVGGLNRTVGAHVSTAPGTNGGRSLAREKKERSTRLARLRAPLPASPRKPRRLSPALVATLSAYRPIFSNMASHLLIRKKTISGVAADERTDSMWQRTGRSHRAQVVPSPVVRLVGTDMINKGTGRVPMLDARLARTGLGQDRTAWAGVLAIARRSSSLTWAEKQSSHAPCHTQSCLA